MAGSRKIAVILSGCGVFDGSEIHEATLTLYAIAKQGAEYEIFAPDLDQMHVINHITGKQMKETRNVLVESARIARGNIKDLSQFKASDFDGVIFPGGFGVARNLSDWAIKGPDCNIIPGVRQAINDFISQGKPIAALCISPVLLAKILKGVEITLGDDPSSIAAVESLGAKHIKTGHREMVIDRKYKTISSPCYMLDATIDQIGDSAEIVVRELLALM